jgi:hypothetical protein
MPKFLVTMNLVEAKATTFVIEAKSSDDVHDALGELDYNYFEENCEWITSDYEPPIVESVEVTKKGLGVCDAKKNKKIQTKFNKIIKELDKTQQ